MRSSGAQDFGVEIELYGCEVESTRLAVRVRASRHFTSPLYKGYTRNRVCMPGLKSYTGVKKTVFQTSATRVLPLASMGSVSTQDRELGLGFRGYQVVVNPKP